MTRIFTPTQLSLFSISHLGSWWEEFNIHKKFTIKLPKPTELESRLIVEGDNHEKKLLEKFKEDKKEIVDLGKLSLSQEEKYFKTIEL